MVKENQNKIDNLITNAMKNLSNMIDVNTIIGKPIQTDIGKIIPISKVSMGFLSGGGEYGEVKYFKKDENYPFSGGSGAIVSMNPVGFLVDNGAGYKIVALKNDMYDKILSICENFLESAKKDE